MYGDRPSSFVHLLGMFKDEYALQGFIGEDYLLRGGHHHCLPKFYQHLCGNRIDAEHGTPLPFVSYGLTSLVSLYLGMGIVLNVGLQSREYRDLPRITRREEYL